MGVNRGASITSRVRSAVRCCHYIKYVKLIEVSSVLYRRKNGSEEGVGWRGG